MIIIIRIFKQICVLHGCTGSYWAQYTLNNNNYYYYHRIINIITITGTIITITITPTYLAVSSLTTRSHLGPGWRLCPLASPCHASRVYVESSGAHVGQAFRATVGQLLGWADGTRSRMG